MGRTIFSSSSGENAERRNSFSKFKDTEENRGKRIKVEEFRGEVRETFEYWEKEIREKYGEETAREFKEAFEEIINAKAHYQEIWEEIEEEGKEVIRWFGWTWRDRSSSEAK